MIKHLVLTNKFGLAIDTNDWLIGVEYSRYLDGDDGYINLLRIGFLCLNFYRGVKGKINYYDTTECFKWRGLERSDK